MRTGLVRVVAREQDHVDDRVESDIEQDVERPFGDVSALGGDLVDRHRGGGSRHNWQATGSTAIV